MCFVFLLCVSHHMFFQAYLTALISFLSSLCSYMDSQVMFLAEVFATFFATIHFLPCVRHHMPGKDYLLIETFATYFAAMCSPRVTSHTVCSVRFPFLLKLSPHTLQQHNFSLVWIFWCALKMQIFTMHFLQIGHLCGLSRVSRPQWNFQFTGYPGLN